MRKISNVKLVNLLLQAENTASISLADVGFQPDGVILKYVETTYQNQGGGGSIGDNAELLKIWCNLYNKNIVCVGIAEGQTNINNVELDVSLFNPLPSELEISVYNFNDDLFTTADNIFLSIQFQFYKYI